MAITLEIPPWHNTDLKKHISTSWKIYGDVNKLDLKHENNNSEHLYKYRVNIILPKDTIWYAIAILHFENSDAISEVPITVINKADIIEHNALNKQYVIDTPIVVVDPLKIAYATTTSIEIETSEYTTLDIGTRLPNKASNHLATHWVITDKVGEILFSSLYDDINKNKISILKSSIKNYAMGNMRICVMYLDENSVESSIGFCDLICSGEITGAMAITSPTITVTNGLIDGKLVKDVVTTFKFNSESKLVPTAPIKEYIIDYGDGSIHETSLDGNGSHIYKGDPATMYTVYVYGVDTLGNVSDKTSMILTMGGIDDANVSYVGVY